MSRTRKQYNQFRRSFGKWVKINAPVIAKCKKFQIFNNCVSIYIDGILSEDTYCAEDSKGNYNNYFRYILKKRKLKEVKG